MQVMDFSQKFSLLHARDLEYVEAQVTHGARVKNYTAKAEDEMGFVTYIKAGLPVTIVSMVVGIGYLLLTG
jgi:hypothetical protein